jgi:uncharacterized LabA/DUF88 family protein
MVTNFYIDGFNLYHGSVKGTEYKWLDISALCQHLFPDRTINKIHYFTARVLRFKHNWAAPDRQDVYLRALRTLPNVVVHREGWFAKRAARLPVYPAAYDANNSLKLTNVLKMEEKRTDVDIATWLLIDCFEGDFDDAVVVSNDSDLVPAIDAVNNRYNKPVWVVNPHFNDSPQRHLVAAASGHYTRINRSALAACQLPSTLTDSGGAITKPLEW